MEKKMSGAATSERVLGTDNRFYSPRKYPEHHAKQIAELSRRNKIHRLEEIEEETKEMKEEIRELKAVLRQANSYAADLKLENERYLLQLGKTATRSGVAVVKDKTVASPLTVPDLEDVEKAKEIAEANTFQTFSPDLDDEPAEQDDDALVAEARDGGKGISAGESVTDDMMEEHITGGNAPSVTENSASS